MLRLLASATIALAIAGCSEPRQLAINYSKADVGDVEAAKDKQAFAKVKGVTNVILEADRSGKVRVQVFVEEGKEVEVYSKADELGYTKIR